MTATLQPKPLEDRLVAVGRHLLEAVAAGIIDPPNHRFLTSGAAPAVDAECAQLTVGLVRILRGVAGRPELTPNARPGVTPITVEWHIELWRCYPIDAEPDTEAVDRQGVAWIRDYAAIKRVIDTLLNPAPQGLPGRLPGAITGMLSDITAIGVEGGMRGIRAICQITPG